MTSIQVFQFQIYDPNTDQMKVSRRWGIRSAIEAIGGHPIESTGTETDESNVRFAASDIDGLSAIGFDPAPPRAGFQTQIE